MYASRKYNFSKVVIVLKFMIIFITIEVSIASSFGRVQNNFQNSKIFELRCNKFKCSFANRVRRKKFFT
ncbi:hypothetical protein CH359_15300 [Leptospira meyeri]|nr:hypothetical protein CH359_15300 [Leptospira meyeri]